MKWFNIYSSRFVLFITSTILFFYYSNAYSQQRGLYDIGKADFFAGNYSSALSNFLKIKKHPSAIKDLNYFIGLSYFNLNKFKEATTYLFLDTKVNKNNLNAYLLKAKAEKELCLFKDAMADLDKILEISKDYFLAFFEKGNLFYEMTNYREAISNYEKAVLIHPNFESAYYKTGFCYLMLKDTVSACRNWKKIEDPDDYPEFQKIEMVCNNFKN